MEQRKDIILHPTFIAVVNGVIGTIVAVQQYFFGDYNNFRIYRQSVFHFLHQQSLYQTYPEQYTGYFVYSPTFTILFMPFALLPVPLGIFAWVMSLMMAFYYALRLLPIRRDKLIFIYFFSLLALVTALQQLDTAPLVAACIMATFVYAERQDYFRATFFPSIGFFVKGYVAVGACFLMLKKFKPRVVPYVLFWVAFFFLLPLIHMSFPKLIDTYRQWGDSYASDRINLVGLSFMGLVRAWTGWPLSVLYTQVVALLMLILTMVLIARRKNYRVIKFYFLSYVLIWVVIFNHLAEVATYIIAMPGIALWYIISRRTWFDKTVIIWTFIVTVLASTALAPDLITGFVTHYRLQALGPSIVFALLQYYLLLKAPDFSHGKAT